MQKETIIAIILISILSLSLIGLIYLNNTQSKNCDLKLNSSIYNSYNQGAIDAFAYVSNTIKDNLNNKGYVNVTIDNRSVILVEYRG